MSLENAPVKRPFDEDISRKTKKQLLEAVENQHVSYLTPEDEGYSQLVASKYSNFVLQQSQEFPERLQEKLAWAFNTLQAEGFFHRDWVRVKGRSFPTYVSRLLIGDPGVTYKYLGLRLFPLPWTFPGRSPQNDIEEACSIIGELNAHFKEMSRKFITEKRVTDVRTGVCTSSNDEGTLVNGNQEPIETKDVTEPDASTGAETTEAENKCAIKSRDHVELESDPSKAAAESKESNSSSTSSKDTSGSDTSTNSRVAHAACNLPLVNPRPPDTDDRPPLSLEEGTDFNVALLNYMDPSDHTLRLKEEPYYGMGELAVSWHMDTGLEKGSTVAVYSHTETEDCERDDCNKWCIGVKVQWDVDTPALAVPLNTGDAYYMLSDLNDTHQHCVVVGSHPRYSSTHRVAECSTGTLSYIQGRCRQALENLEMGGDDVGPSLKSTSIDVISFTEDIHIELEFEWLRQFWMQGNTRANERDFWRQHMEGLEGMWKQMELMTKLAIGAAMEGSSRDHHVLCESLIDYLSRRNRLRQEHVNRFGGKALVTMPSDEMPSYRPSWQATDANHPLPFDLDDIIHRLICHIDADYT
ncbi:alpha-ketoglutarate-dependent dioxygenase FTO-like [Amphiura filiformis]|uniref:alpha-ketoglutarate-dependent dioxygenase FTO-like n=1 Tax=Amphiura filiformis TaxID=82378 RepID=UPI003B216A15